MIICDFTKAELQYFVDNCNFTDIELEIFNLRASGKTLQDIADAMNLSIDCVRKRSQRINRKILRVI